jgi:IS6 family transposase
MQATNPFKWRDYQAESILQCVRWDLGDSVSYREVEELLAERGLPVDPSTIAGWVLADAPELARRVKPQLKPTTDSWRVAETYIQGQGEWRSQYRAVASDGQTVEFWFSAERDAAVAQAFVEKALSAPHTVLPRVSNVDKNAAYPQAVEILKAHDPLPPDCELRQVKSLNKRIEQDHRFIKRRTRPGLGCCAFDRAPRTLSGYETMNMIRKGQVKGVDKGDIRAQTHLISRVFGLAA